MLIYNEKPVCNDQFSNISANAVCKEMGYEGGSAKGRQIDWSLPSSYSWKIICTEPSWSSCSYDEITHTECGEKWYVIMKCSGRLPSCPAERCSGQPAGAPKTSTGQAFLICSTAVLIVACSILTFLLIKERQKKTSHDMAIESAYANPPGDTGTVLESINQGSMIQSKYEEIVINNSPESTQTCPNLEEEVEDVFISPIYSTLNKE